LLSIKTVLENQVVQKEQILKLENEYTFKMNKVNDELLENIKQLNEKNKRVQEERNNILTQYSQIEEKNREAFVNVFKENDRLNSENVLLEREKEIIKEKEKINEMELKRTRNALEEEARRREEVEASKRKLMEYKRIETITEIESYSIANKSVSPPKRESKAVSPEKEISKRKGGKLDEIRRKNREKSIKSNESKEEIVQKVVGSSKPVVEQKAVEKPKQIVKDEFEFGDEPKSEPKAKAATEPVKAPLVKKSTMENLLDTKPELRKVGLKHKLKVLKVLLPEVEKYAKTLKPNVFIYNPKLLSNINKSSIAGIFYDILSNETIELIDNNQKQILLSELLKSNESPNISPDMLKLKEFNEQMFMDNLNEGIHELFVRFSLIFRKLSSSI
jgi:hypothetical protein